MSFYEPQGWQAPVRQTSWEQPAPPSRSGASSTSQRDEPNAFATQFEEVDRAIDNLLKSGKFHPQGHRRDHASQSYGGGMGRHSDFNGQRFHGGRHSVSENHSVRHGSPANQQNFYASQRFQGRPSDGDPMLQAKRRMAAQRERELRNYHQEQQYNRSVLAEMASNKSERSMSPSTLSEEGRRELIARQHRALYGGDSAGLTGPQGTIGDEAAASASAIRVSSPRGIDPFGGPAQGDGAQNAAPERKGGSPTSQQPAGQTTPPGGEDSAHTRHISKSTTVPLSGNMGPIGSRPPNQGGQAPVLNKRTTSPLPSTLGYGFGTGDQNNERSGSSNSNNQQKENSSPIGAWGTGSGVWGSGKIGTTSVWA